MDLRSNLDWLEVSIFHKSLTGSQPDAVSHHWYKKVMDF
jgi:hypothetical protein